ncbi:TetR/AcrR family transcriptional regulator [Aquimarina sp. ERC-38]|uniref:TetR/AcrR family transcriptional regulator n=1 Tax=Aquimarina sp. ERC-38 TaxID=2949996 RepID=UPI0022486049|nr:TetR/AcrR family transcriptional regulator [Aquimarina sp. ERC-38]UZO80367.1 TetR/AcrR family transcriptional regulator [Aquimarina sp. ERC-38]
MVELSKGEIKRKALVDATISLVNNNGFHAAPVSKIAKMANVSPATIYLYFEDKQDLVNKVYIEVKESFTAYTFKTYTKSMPVAEGFKLIWKRIATFKTTEIAKAIFLAQCDNTPIIDESSRQEGIRHLQPLLDLWKRGKEEGVIKPLSDYLLYAYTINPLSFLIVMQQQGAFTIEEKHIEEAYHAAWNSIKL